MRLSLWSHNNILYRIALHTQCRKPSPCGPRPSLSGSRARSGLSRMQRLRRYSHWLAPDNKGLQTGNNQLQTATKRKRALEMTFESHRFQMSLWPLSRPPARRQSLARVQVCRGDSELFKLNHRRRANDRDSQSRPVARSRLRRWSPPQPRQLQLLRLHATGPGRGGQ